MGYLFEACFAGQLVSRIKVIPDLSAAAEVWPASLIDPAIVFTVPSPVHVDVILVYIVVVV